MMVIMFKALMIYVALELAVYTFPRATMATVRLFGFGMAFRSSAKKRKAMRTLSRDRFAN